MSIVANRARQGQSMPLWDALPAHSRPSKSSRELIEKAERACRTGQPRLAMTYLEAADRARVFERIQWAADWIVIAETRRRQAAEDRARRAGEAVGAFLSALFGIAQERER